MEGWISLNRSLLDNEIWISEPFSRGQAWVDLLLLANHKDSYFIKRGTKIIVKRGQIGRSMKGFGDRWKWSIGKVNRFLILLENENQISISKSNLTTTITIIKYDSLQSKENKEKAKRNQMETKEKPNGNQMETYNNVNNVNNEKNKEEEVKEVVPPTQIVLDFKESEHEDQLVGGFRNFVKFIEETKLVKTLESQITIKNYKKICDEYGRDKLWQKITDLDNWLDDPNVAKGKKKGKKSVYHLMVNTWLKNGY